VGSDPPPDDMRLAGYALPPTSNGLVRSFPAGPRLVGRQALTGQALVHGYTTAFWWTAGIFAGGAVICGALVRSGPRAPDGTWRDLDTA